MYRLGIWLIALALVFDGTPTYALNDLSGVPAGFAHDHHDEAAAVDCDVHSGDVAVITADACQTRHATHDHLKCCWICNVVTMLPAITAVPLRYSCAPVSFSTAQFDLVGHPVTLDPDIPKTVV